MVVDEFAELLQSHPDFVGLFDRICRVGRSLRVHLLLATQSLQTGGARIDKLEPNLTYRIALRTTSSHESKSVIGTPEAQYITNKESGVGFLRVGMEDTPYMLGADGQVRPTDNVELCETALAHVLREGATVSADGPGLLARVGDVALAA